MGRYRKLAALLGQVIYRKAEVAAAFGAFASKVTGHAADISQIPTRVNIS
jgi:hypothetical protein